MESRILILGATGMIGAHAVRAAVRHGIRVRALLRPASDRQLLAGLDVEMVCGDLHDRASLERAFADCDLAAHAAAPYPRRSLGKSALLATARSGMANLLAAAAHAAQSAGDHPLRRLVYVSSATTIGRPPPTPARPARESDEEPVRESCAYFALKFMLESMAGDAARAGTPIVIVNPTFCVDEFDSHRTTAQLMLPLARRQIPAYLHGLLNAVATRDVGEGIILAALRGRPGERYILGGENLTSREFLARCARVAGVPAPKRAFPLPLAETVSWATEIIGWLTGTAPLFPLTGIRMIKQGQPFDIGRARAELGYEPTSIDAAMERAYAWYRQRGWLPARG